MDRSRAIFSCALRRIKKESHLSEPPHLSLSAIDGEIHMMTTHDVFLLIQYYFRSGQIIAGCSPPLPAAHRSLVKAVVLKATKPEKLLKRKTVTTNTQPRYKNCQPKAVTGRIGCTSGQT